MRSIAMNCFIRILWIYLNRCPESSTSTRKRLDTLLRVCFPANGSLYPPELALEPFVAIIHYISARQLDYGEDLIAEFLKPEATGREGGAELPPVDRACATVRAAVHTLYTIELERPAPWPQITDFTRFSLEGFETSGKPLPIDIASKAEVTGFLNRCGPATTKLLIGCDRAVGSLLLSADALTLSAHASSSSMDGPTDQLTRKHGDIHVTYAARHDPILRLFSAVLAGFPRCSASGMNLNQIANTICRGTFSADPLVCHAAGDALRRLAENPEHCHILVVTYLQFVFETRHIFRDTLIGLRLLESQFERVVKLWLDLLQHLVTHQRLHVTQHLSGGSLLAQPVINPVPIDKIEGCALFLLCSTSLPIRRLAGQILLAARDLDLEDKERRPSAAFRYSRIPSAKPTIARVLQLYEGSWDEGDLAAIRSLPWCTSSDRNRLDLATAKDKMKVMQRIAESDNAKDAALWLSLLPYFVSRLAEHFAAATNALRFVISAIVLRLQGHIASVANASRTVPGLRQAAPTRSSTDIAVLADHWRSYLTVLCVTLQTRQPGPATPPVQRTREAIILTPDTIDSPALLHYLTTLLSWEDPRFRDVAVYALGSIGQSLLRPISEILLGVVRRLADGSKIGGTPREGSRGPAVATPLWTAVAHVFRLISPLILDGKSSSHLANLSSLIGFVKITYTLLADRNVKENYELQNLRRSFCVVVENLTNALAKLDASDRFLGEEIRGAIFKLFYEWCHVGRRPDIAKARESQTLQAAAESYRGDRDRAKYLDDLQAKTKLLSAAAAEAMAGLCVSDISFIKASH